MADEGMVMEVEQPVESTSGESQQTEQVTTHEEYDPFESKSARELSQWLKAQRDADPANAKFARALKDVFGQQFAFKKEFQGGLDEARGMKALVDSVIHTDPERGELKGAEAIAALQDTVREYAEIDELLAQGDPKALESLDDSFNGGLAKLAPAILERVEQSDSEAYAAAVLPHFVKALAQSELVSNFNGLVDVLNEAPPSWLTSEQKTAWAADQQRKVVALAGNMGRWLNAQADKAKQMPQNGAAKSVDSAGKRTAPTEEEAWRKEQQEHHWNANISPKLDAHAAAEFTKLFQPYAKRLNLDTMTTNALKMEFSKRVAATAAKDAAYISQIKRYRGMRNPDPATVLNYAKVNFDKHSKTVMDALVNERYKPFLNGKPRNNATVNQNSNGKGVPPAKGIQFVTVRPADSQIDHKNRTLDQIHAKIFPLLNGKVVQVRA